MGWGCVNPPCRDQSPSCRLGSPVSYFAVPLPAFTSCRRSAVASTLYGSAAPSQTQVLSTRSRGQLKATEQHPLTAALQRGDAKSGGGGCLRNVWRGRQQVRSRNDRDTRSGERPRDPLLRREHIPMDAQWAVARRLRTLHVRDKGLPQWPIKEGDLMDVAWLVQGSTTANDGIRACDDEKCLCPRVTQTHRPWPQG